MYRICYNQDSLLSLWRNPEFGKGNEGGKKTNSFPWEEIGSRWGETPASITKVILTGKDDILIKLYLTKNTFIQWQLIQTHATERI